MGNRDRDLCSMTRASRSASGDIRCRHAPRPRFGRSLAATRGGSVPDDAGRSREKMLAAVVRLRSAEPGAVT